MDKQIKFLQSTIAKIADMEEKKPGTISDAKDFAALCSSLKDLVLASLLQDLREGKLKLVNNPLNTSQWGLERSNKS